MIWKDDPEAINYVKKRKNMKTYEELDTNLGEISEASQRELEAKAEIRLNMDTKESQENSVYCVVFFLALFFTLSFNFFYKMFFQEIMLDSISIFIKLSDSIKIDTHFIRYLYLTFFQERIVHTYNQFYVLKDCFIFAFAICPMFMIGLRFWTAPVYLMYSLRINSLIIPLTLPVIFFCSHLDILLLGGLVFLMNIYVFWYHIDPPANTFAGGKYQKYTKDVSSDDDDTVTRRQVRQVDYAEMASFGLQAMSMGMPLPNPYMNYTD